MQCARRSVDTLEQEHARTDANVSPLQFHRQICTNGPARPASNALVELDHRPVQVNAPETTMRMPLVLIRRPRPLQPAQDLA